MKYYACEKMTRNCNAVPCPYAKPTTKTPPPQCNKGVFQPNIFNQDEKVYCEDCLENTECFLSGFQIEDYSGKIVRDIKNLVPEYCPLNKNTQLKFKKVADFE